MRCQLHIAKILFEEKILTVCEAQVLNLNCGLPAICRNDWSNLFTFLIITFQTNKPLKSNGHDNWPTNPVPYIEQVGSLGHPE